MKNETDEEEIVVPDSAPTVQVFSFQTFDSVSIDVIAILMGAINVFLGANFDWTSVDRGPRTS